MRSLRVLGIGLCLVLLAAGNALGQDVTGKWVLSVELGELGGGEATFDFKQDGKVITGTYAGALGEVALTGEIEGDEIEFSFETEFGTVTYIGTVTGTTMEGTCDYGFASGTFKGGKVEDAGSAGAIN